MDDDEVNFLRHVAGPYDRVLGQLCSRCGAVLDKGASSTDKRLGSGGPFRHGAEVLVSPGGGFLAGGAGLRADRDRSDESDCESVL